MKFSDKKFFKTGSVRARCQTHKEKILFTMVLVSTLVLLMTSLMWTPAEATYTTDGFGLFVNGELTVPTITSDEAQAILQGVKDRYVQDGVSVVQMSFAEDVTIEECKIIAQDVKNAEEGIACIVNRKKPLITVVSTQSYTVYEDVQEERTYSAGSFSYNVFDKIKVDNFKAGRAYDVLLTMENDLILKREIKNERLFVTAENQPGYKGLQFTEDEAMRMDLAFVAPVPLHVTSAYGVSRMETGYHLGVDLYNPSGTPIVAAASGIVSCVTNGGSYGKLIIINHVGNVQTYYAHCNSTDVQVGDTVHAGDFIGTVGNTGRTTGPHLHFELRLNGGTLNPMDFL